MTSKPYKIAPTDLTFLLGNCPACFHHKVVHKTPQITGPFPSVFRSLDADQRAALHGCQGFLGLGLMDTTNRYLKSAPIEVDGISMFFAGYADAATTTGIRDFKVAAGTPDDLKLTNNNWIPKNWDFYRPQLYALNQGVLHPAKSKAKIPESRIIATSEIKPIEVSMIAFYPNGFDRTDRSHRMTVRVHTEKLGGDWWLGEFLPKIAKIIRIEPEPTPGCYNCFLRKHGYHDELKAIKDAKAKAGKG